MMNILPKELQSIIKRYVHQYRMVQLNIEYSSFVTCNEDYVYIRGYFVNDRSYKHKVWTAECRDPMITNIRHHRFKYGGAYHRCDVTDNKIPENY